VDEKGKIVKSERKKKGIKKIERGFELPNVENIEGKESGGKYTRCERGSPTDDTEKHGGSSTSGNQLAFPPHSEGPRRKGPRRNAKPCYGCKTKS